MTRIPRPRAGLVRLALAAGLLVALAAGCAHFGYNERQLTFRPSKDVAVWFAGIPAGAQEVFVPVGHSSDGDATAQKMHAWWWPAADKGAPAVLYLHGARWNLTGQTRRIEQLHRFGFSVFAIDYRGFGKSDGDLPSEDSVYEDAQAAWRWLGERQPDASRRFIYGHSLGGAVAIDLAARLSGDGAEVGGLVAESTFTTLADVAAALTSDWLPTKLILSQKFDSVDKIARVTMPVIIAHGASDRMVPSRFSEALYKAAPAPKKLLLVDGAGHNNTMIVGEQEYRQALAELFSLPEVAAVQLAASVRNTRVAN
ncbi:MAG: alpha/beta fold hydrolase [Casimicrobiaceae bacterium]